MTRMLRVLLPLATALVLLVAPSAANAGTYTVYSCRDATGALASTSSWSFVLSTPSVGSHDDTCPRGGVHVALKAGVAQPAQADARMWFLAPDDTTIVNYTLWRSARVAAGTPYWFSAQEEYGTDWRWAGPSCKGTTNNCSGIGNPADPMSAANRWARTPTTPIKGVALYVSCGNANSGTTACPASSGVSSEAWLHRGDITLADDIKPKLETTPVGALVDATANVQGTAAVSIQASDKGGGLAQAQVEIDGKVVASKGFGSSPCRQPYTARVPCPLRSSTTVPFDTTTLADGTHSVRVLVQDAGGNTTAWGPVKLTTHNAPLDQSCNPEPAAPASGLTLSGRLARSGSRALGRSALTIRWATSRRARLSGRLLGAGGAPVSGAPVCIAWRPSGLDAPLEPLARLTTDATGRYATTIPRGSSRDLYAIYRTSAGAVAKKTILRVIPRLSVRRSARNLANGDVLTVRGSLRGGPIPSRGVLVRAEAWRGTRWQPFGEVRAKGSSGRYRIRYRFTGTRGVQRYTLRVRVVPQAAYPYLGVTSPRFHVRVRG
jgi:hypothetical protein